MGDKETFLGLIRRHGDRIYNFAYRLAGNEQDARDLVQEALMRAFEHRGDYDPSRPFESWLFRILQNVYLDGVRRYERRHADPIGDEAERFEGPDPDPAAAAVRHEQQELFQRALSSLPVHYRSAVVLNDIEGLSYEEAAKVMGCPLGTVRSRVHQGRILLRKAIERLEEGLPS